MRTTARLQRPLRLTLVTETFPPEVNGVARTLGLWDKTFRSRGHQIQLIRPRQPREKATAERVHGLPGPFYPQMRFGIASPMRVMHLLEKGLTNHRVRWEASLGAVAGQGFTSHTFCEVFVGGRWRRLNFTTLGQNVLERNYLGLMVHVHTFNDLSEAKLAETWGTRYATGRRDETFPRNNPYRLLEVSDHFGKYAKEPNPPAAEHTSITIGKAYWLGSKGMHAWLRERAGGPSQDGSGRLFFHGEEWLNNAGDYLQYKAFLWRADPEFVLKAKGQPDVKARLGGAYYTYSSEKLR